jgi:hypothetical protein
MLQRSHEIPDRGMGHFTTMGSKLLLTGNTMLFLCFLRGFQKRDAGASIMTIVLIW